MYNVHRFSSHSGFHGSPFENFHSIVRNGLDASFGKETSLFGDGIYLSEDQYEILAYFSVYVCEDFSLPYREVAFSFLRPGRNMAPRSSTGQLVGCLVCGEVATVREPFARDQFFRIV